MATKTPSRQAHDNRANQLNPTHPAYHRSRGASPSEADAGAAHATAALENRAQQLSSENDAEETSSAEQAPSD